MTRINLKKPQFCLAAALLWIVLCVIATPVYTTVTLSFQDDPEGATRSHDWRRLL